MVMALGYGGLIPFLALAAGRLLDASHTTLWANALLGYGAVILSFVGALHWGFAMVHPRLAASTHPAVYAWSVVPSLLGWVALLLIPKTAVALLLAGFWAHYRQDRRLARAVDLPGWYLPLRLRLTAVASLSLVTLFLG
jgi:hypothetical protein